MFRGEFEGGGEADFDETDADDTEEGSPISGAENAEDTDSDEQV